MKNHKIHNRIVSLESYIIRDFYNENLDLWKYIADIPKQNEIKSHKK